MDVFRSGIPSGSLVYMESGTSGMGDYEFELWFPYTRELIRMLRKGSLVAVKNFDSDSSSEKYSILELLEVLPTHYALGASRGQLERTYPGHLVEAAKSARTDWEQEEPTESTTQIRCQASATGRGLHFDSSGSAHPHPDDALPMWGEDARILSNEMVEEVVNGELLTSGRKTVELGCLKLDEDIPFHMDVSDLLKTHFGLFGFTGAGKSNALSTLVSESLQSESNVTLVIFDLMGEYTGLLADLICMYEDALIVVLDSDSVPGGSSTLDYFEGRGGVDKAVRKAVETILLPRELERRREEFKPLMRKILEEDKIRMISREKITVGELLEEFDSAISRPSANTKIVRQRLHEILPSDEASEVASTYLDRIVKDIERVLKHKKVPSSPTEWGEKKTLNGTPSDFTTSEFQKPSVPQLANFRSFKNALHALQREMETEIKNAISHEEVLRKMDASGPTLIVIQSDKSDLLKESAARTMWAKYNERRAIGRKYPQIAFVFDEADEFIPRTAPNDPTKRAKAAIENVARRGRKFGLGMGIATQRATYLDTSIMAQPHTYMISKLPRREDRERVGDAFGLSRATLDRTLGFQVGEWLTISFEATGLVGVPAPVRFKNANERLESYLATQP